MQPKMGAMGGFLGFDYRALEFLLKVKQVPECKWLEALEAVESLTQVASKHWNEKTDN